jgi:asparagine synthase (glutamine-hydrolysing)
MRQTVGPDVRTFTIGFDDQAADESPSAAAVARHLNTRHTVLQVTADDVLSAVQQLPRVFDEPFADSSQLPTWVLSRLTREHVTVALSGDGGDELFCGYRTYASLQRRAWVLNMPYALRRLGERAGRGWLFPERIAEALRARGPVELADALWNVASRSRARSMLGVPALPTSPPAGASTSANTVEALMYSDLTRYLPGDLLTKVDRTSMSCGLEVRVPLLDHRLVEYVLQLPPSLRCDPARPKSILRTLLARYVPPTFTERPKHGFSVPLASWLRRELRPMREEYLGIEALRNQDVLDPTAVEACVREFDERGTGANLVWALLVLRQWLEHNGLARGVRAV